jgi:hypothetical protein
MKLWRWFVGQVARLRRSVVGVFASGSQPLHADDRLTSADEPAPGPPAHWVERVRRGAPGLLEPSFRRRGGPVEPPLANRVALSQNGLEPKPEPLEEPERGDVRTEPTVAAQRPEAPVRTPLERIVRALRLRKVLRRVPSRAAAEDSPPTAADQVPHELEPSTRLVDELPDSPVEPEAPRELDRAPRRVSERAAEPDRRRLAGESGRRHAAPRPVGDELERSQRPPVPDKPERPARGSEPERSSAQSEVIEFEAPVQRRTARSAASPDSPLEAGVAPSSATNVPHAEVAIAEIRNNRVSERAMASPSPRQSDGRREPVLTPPSPPSVGPDPHPRRRAEPLSDVDRHPWPELPPPLDQPDSDVEAALRAWEHQRRLDLEQTRL